MKNGEEIAQEVDYGGVLPSGDGTYQMWVSVDPDPQSKDVYLVLWSTLAPRESESILLTVKVISGPIILTIVLAGAGVLTWRRSREQEEVIYHPTKSAGTALPFRRAPTCPLSGVSAMHLTQWGLRELSICDKKTGATNFSLFFGSRKAVNFQALDGLLYHSRL
ncbi:hypothetical protein NN561_001011 [Cricetulus griseus]